MANIRVRFAPTVASPINISNARTAVINYLFAKKNGGEFIIRIDDVDKESSASNAVEQILDDLRWLKLDWNEGPSCGGNFGPYKQSLRTKIYKEHINILIDKELLYPCYCQKDFSGLQPDEVSESNKISKYDNRCRNLTEVEKLSFENQGVKPVWRFKVDPRKIVIKDIIKGEVRFDTSQLGDFVVLKPDGTPMRSLMDTVDDHLMEISHIIRCGELFETTIVNILLCNAFDYPVPEFAHLGLLKGGGNSLFPIIEQNSLSIRKFRKKGYIPEAIVNYLVNISIAEEKDENFFLLNKPAEKFNLSKISGTDIDFDKNTFDRFGNYYIQHADIARITDLTMPYLKENNLITGYLTEDKYQYLIDVVEVIRHNVFSLSEITKCASVFLQDLVALPETLINELQGDESRAVLISLLELIDEIDCLDKKNLCEIMSDKIALKISVDKKRVYQIFRWALTGTEEGLEMNDVLRLLSKEKIKLRIENILK